jgi:hypothetical protein
MKARLSTVQLTLFLLLFASLACAVVARPHPENSRFMEALDEMSRFRDGFKRGELEKSLLDYARAQGTLPLAVVASAARGRQVPPVQPSKSAPPLQPTAAVQLQTLSDVRARSQAQSTLVIGVPRAADLGPSIAWRMARVPDASPWTLASIELAPARVGQADVDLEHEVARLRVEALNAQKTVDDATKKLDTAEQLFETRRKWKLPWKILVKSDEARKEARATLEAHQGVLTDTKGRYETQASRAQAARPTSNAFQPGAAFALAKVALEHNHSPTTFEVPVALELRNTPVPTLRGGDFAATRKAGLWPEVKDLDADGAIDAIRRHFNWHYRFVELLGVRVGGMTLLQLLPCVLPVLLMLVVLRMRAVSESYNPFGTTIDSSLPRVGFRSRTMDCAALVILPVAAAASAAAALLFIGQVPALPVLVAIACLGLGIYAFGKLGELQALIEAVVHSHSNPPPRDLSDKSVPKPE